MLPTFEATSAGYVPDRAEQAIPSRPRRALLIAEGFRLQYRVLRCAAAAFDEVVVLGAEEAWPLRLSRLCRRYVSLGRTCFEEGDVAGIEALCERLDIDLVVPSCGATTRFIAQHRAKLRVRCYAGPSLDTFDLLDDKGRFADLCRRLDIPHPDTSIFENGDDVAAALRAGSLRGPLIVKPPNLWGSRGVCKVEQPSDLAGIDYRPVLVQTYIPGRDLIAFFCCRGGRVLAHVLYVKTAEGVEFLAADDVISLAGRMIADLELDGVIGFDIRQAADGRIYFIECNPRFWYNMDLVMLAGLNFVALGIAPETKDAGAALGTVTRPWALLRKLARPWRLTATDRKLLRMAATDPAPLGWMAFQRLRGGYRGALGQQF